MTGDRTIPNLSAGFLQRAGLQLATVCSDSFTAIGGTELRDSWSLISPEIATSQSATGIAIRGVVSRAMPDGSTQQKEFMLLYDSAENFVDFTVGFTTTLVRHETVDDEIPALVEVAPAAAAAAAAAGTSEN